MPHDITFQRVEEPTEKLVDESACLFAALMKNDHGALSLVGNDADLMYHLTRAMIGAAVVAGEYYTATNSRGDLVGFSVWMPPGQEMFSTEEQRKMGLHEYMSRLSEDGKAYFSTTYMAEFPAFVAKSIGPTGKLDSWWLHTLMVRQDYQKQGIAQALIRIVREKASKKGETIALSTTSDINATIYSKMGLEMKGHRIMPSPWGEWPLYVFLLETAMGTD